MSQFLGIVTQNSSMVIRKHSSFTKDLLVVIASGFHLFPFRTEKLSRSALMVLPLGGRVGRCQLNTTHTASFVNSDGAFVCLGVNKTQTNPTQPNSPPTRNHRRRTAVRLYTIYNV